MWNPCICILTFMILTIPWGSHACIEFFLLWIRTLRWIIANMICDISWIWFYCYIITVEFSVFDFASFINMSCCSNWDSILHIWIFFLNITSWFFITPNINICDWVMSQELFERTKWIDTTVGYHWWFESLWTIFKTDQKKR